MTLTVFFIIDLLISGIFVILVSESIWWSRGASSHWSRLSGGLLLLLSCRRHTTLPRLLRLQSFIRQLALCDARHGASEEFRVDTSEHFMVQLVAVVLDRDGLVLQRDRILLDAILLQEIEEGLIAEHLGDF